MLEKITVKDCDNFQFIELTPSCGKAYYDSGLDIAVIVYKNYLKGYYDRGSTIVGKTASCFNKYVVNPITCGNI